MNYRFYCLIQAWEQENYVSPPLPFNFRASEIFFSRLEIQQLPEKCAFDIHKNCEKKIFDQVVVNHLSWPETTKWRQCYLKALLQTPCSALILQNYAALQEKFGESFRKKEFDLGLYGIFMNDHHLQSNGTVEIL